MPYKVFNKFADLQVDSVVGDGLLMAFFIIRISNAYRFIISCPQAHLKILVTQAAYTTTDVGPLADNVPFPPPPAPLKPGSPTALWGIAPHCRILGSGPADERRTKSNVREEQRKCYRPSHA